MGMPARHFDLYGLLSIMSNCETFPDKILSIQLYGLYTHLSNSVIFSDKNTLFKQIWFFFKKNLSIKDFFKLYYIYYIYQHIN